MIVTLKERHTYRCNHSQADGIVWRVNGRVLIHPPNIATISESLPDGGVIYLLTIGGFTDHNGTTIHCEAIRDDETVIAKSPIAVFYIQGLLHLQARE